MLAGLTFLACVLYLTPLLLLAGILRKPEDGPLDLACTLGSLFAVDLVGTFLLTYAMPVDRASFTRTFVLLGLGVVLIVRRAKRGVGLWPGRGALSRADVQALLCAAVIAFVVSYSVSAYNWIWDREWHVPFTASLRGQEMPFRNVYEPAKTFRYHLIGDLVGAILQSLSFGAMSASRSLSIAHDLLSMLLAAMIVLLLRTRWSWSPLTSAVAAMVPMLAGPIAIRAGSLGAYEGFSDFNTFTLSFRPHCMVALVLLVGIFSHVVRLSKRRSEDQASRSADLVGLIPLVALLGIADEISTVLVGAALGVLWLRWPGLLGKKRWHGAAMLGVFGLGALLANLLLAGTIAPGGPIQGARWVAPRLPYFSPTNTSIGQGGEAWVQLLVDVASTVIPLGVVVYILVRDRRTPDALLLPSVFGVTAALGSLLLFLCFEVNGRTFEGHRFMTAGRILVPIIALLLLPKVARGSFASLLLVIPMLGGVFASFGYAYYRLPTGGHRQDEQYDVNCRSQYNARLGERMRPTWIDDQIWYLYAGCHPIFAAPASPPGDVVLVGWPDSGVRAFARMNALFFPRNEPARLICSNDPKKTTLLCQKALAMGVCRQEGTDAQVCSVPPGRRAELARLPY